MSEELRLTSRDFLEGDFIPVRNSGRGEDISPCLLLNGLTPDARSIAITLDDASHPLFPNYSHWVIWNIPVQSVIPSAVAHGKVVHDLGGAVQGIAYGRHRYKGPKPPFRWIHEYVFTAYVLDCMCELPPESKKAELLAWMEGHILQKAALMGKFQSGR